MSQKRLHKLKPLQRAKLAESLRNSEPAKLNPTGQQTVSHVGFPDFWPKAQESFPSFFPAAVRLMETSNRFLSKPVKGQLNVTLHMMFGSVTNSLGAVLTLTLNGYGHDAVRIARSMFETAINAEYLRRNPSELDDFLDFHWVRLRQTLEYYRDYAPDELTPNLKPQIDEIEDQFARVQERFANKKGKVRASWAKQDLRQRCEAIGTPEFYPMFYQYASDFEHGNIQALAHQVTDLTIDSAPTLKSVEMALKIAHWSALYLLGAFHSAADIQLESDVKACVSDFQGAWAVPAAKSE